MVSIRYFVGVWLAWLLKRRWLFAVMSTNLPGDATVDAGSEDVTSSAVFVCADAIETKTGHRKQRMIELLNIRSILLFCRGNEDNMQDYSSWSCEFADRL
jgi:hypothetical protein